MEIGTPTAGHFIYIPVILLLGIVDRLGARLARRRRRDGDGAAKREERAQRKSRRRDELTIGADRGVSSPRALAAGVYRPIISRCASASGRPASRMRACVRSIG